ncbi:hypothetical protein RW1_036_00900 [Rhodococcus wratislaviensis NBRC 100605]|uniref:dTDP-4-dehydrorhamnose 3,5-epimerase n=1 Tax=Rhodococcus wratislaviensis NBRC 100605 TaxID=1219028 RepID=X0Q6S4_RHOWR|nr:hypothetical protein RW1_036_00900 [Rhodococcus wratislaviensis NBRC 100605]
MSSGYVPNRKHGNNPLDPEVGIDWPTVDRSGSPLNVILSDKDTAAPSLAEAAAGRILPEYDMVRTWVDGVR